MLGQWHRRSPGMEPIHIGGSSRRHCAGGKSERLGWPIPAELTTRRFRKPVDRVLQLSVAFLSSIDDFRH